MRARSAQDDKGRFVHLNDIKVLRSWCDLWGCSEDQLHQAVRAVGNLAKAIQAFLERNPEDDRPLWSASGHSVPPKPNFNVPTAIGHRGMGVGAPVGQQGHVRRRPNCRSVALSVIASRPTGANGPADCSRDLLTDEIPVIAHLQPGRRLQHLQHGGGQEAIALRKISDCTRRGSDISGLPLGPLRKAHCAALRRL